MFSPCSALHFRTTTTDHDIDTEITAQHRHSYTLREDLDAIVRANRRLAVKKKSPLGEAFPPSISRHRGTLRQTARKLRIRQ